MKFLQKNYIKYTLLMCAILIAGLTNMELSGKNQNFENGGAVFLFTIAIPFVVWWLGIKARKKELKNKITFKQAFLEGWYITLAFAFISPIIFTVYYTVVNPAIVEWVRHGSTAPTWLVIAQDMSLQVTSTIIIGVPTSALIAFFLKSKKK